MRTTLTIDEDVAIIIARRRRERETGLKEEINHLLRVGMAHADERKPQRLGRTDVGLVALLHTTGVMPAVLTRPLTPPAAWAIVTGWLDQPPAWVPEPTHSPPRDIVGRLLERETRADLVPDAQLAALAIEHGLTLCSADRDFGRFEGPRWENPVAG